MKRTILLAAAALALAAVPAGATIVVQQGMAGLKLGMTRVQAHARRGAPTSSKVVKDTILGKVRIERYGSVQVGYDGNKASSKIVNFDTTGTAQRTSKGIGVGSKEADVAARVRHATCSDADGFEHCVVGEFATPGKTATVFFINSHGRVGRVSIGITID
jgi:hypothetical protein